MNFTVKNLKQEVPKISNFDKELKRRWEKVIQPNLDLYDKSETIKRGTDLFVMLLNKRYGDSEPSPKSPPSQKQKKEKPKKEKKDSFDTITVKMYEQEKIVNFYNKKYNYDIDLAI